MSDPEADPPSFWERPGLNVASYDLRARFDALLFGDHADFYVARARESAGPVLELGSGTGRVSLRMAVEAGAVVTGVEPSAPMREYAERAREDTEAGAARRVHFITGDMTDLDLASRFGLVVIPFRGFQELLTVADQFRALAAVRRHLAPGGRLVFDVFDPRLERLGAEGEAMPFDLPLMPMADGHRLKVTITGRDNDPLRQIMRERWRFAELNGDGTEARVEEGLLTLRWATRAEMRHLLARAGFSVIAEYGDFEGGPPRYGGEQVWIAEAS